MKVSKNLFTVIAAIMIIIAIVGPLDQRANTFIKGATEKTMKFHSLISDVKLVLAGLSKINIPFISGHTDELGDSLSKAKDYLLKISAIVFSQLMLLSISQTWIFKILLILLFVLYVLRKSSLLAAKFLIMFLAINPGLSIYSSGVDFISQKSSIDFGTAYLTKLEAQVTAIKKEKSQLMDQHEQQHAQIRNGEKHVNIFGKLKEDVSYDFKKVGDDVKGGFSNIRLLIHEAGHEMTMKVYNFCTMVLFSFLLLPLGYSLIIYVLYKNMFHSVSVMVEDGKQLLHEGEGEIKSLPLTTRITNAVKAAWRELVAIPEKIVEDIEHKTADVDSDIHNRITGIREEFQNEIQQIKSDIRARVVHGEEKMEGDVAQVRDQITGKIDQVGKDIRNDASDTLDTVKTDVDHVKDDIHNKANDLKTNIITDATGVENKVLDDVHGVENNIHQKADDLKQDVQSDVSNVQNKVHTDVEDTRQKVVSDVQSVKQGIDTDIDQVKEGINDDIDSVQDKVGEVESQVKGDLNITSEVVKDKIIDVQQEIDQDKNDVEEHMSDAVSTAQDDLNSAKDHLKSDAQDLANKTEEDVDVIKKKVEGNDDGPIISL